MKKFLLPSLGDPLMFNYWLNNYDTVWGKEVDGGVVSIASPLESEVVEWIRNQCRVRNIDFTYRKVESQAQHGQQLEYCLELIDNKDDIIILEDDTLINEAGIISNWFAMLKNDCPLIGASRNCMSPEIINEALRQHKIAGEVGFQTAFLVLNAKIIKDIAEKHKNTNFFGVVHFPAGQPVEYLNNYIPKEVCSSDTFDGVSLALLSKIDATKIHKTISYRGAGEDPTVDLKLPYINIGSLSMGIGRNGMLRDQNGRSLVVRKEQYIDTQPSSIPKNERWQYERMLAWFMAFHMSWRHQELKEFADCYLYGIHSCISRFELDGLKIINWAKQLAI